MIVFYSYAHHLTHLADYPESLLYPPLGEPSLHRLSLTIKASSDAMGASTDYILQLNLPVFIGGLPHQAFEFFIF